MKNKLTKILLINLLIFVLIFILLNFCTEAIFISKKINIIEQIQIKIRDNFTLNKNKPFVDITKYETEIETVKRLDFNEKNINHFCGADYTLHGTENNYTKNSIIVLGCSYVYGHGLKKEQTFSNILSNLTQRPVFNFSQCGTELIESFNHLQDYGNFKEEIHNADYVIYVYMYDHINRYLDLFGNNRKYFYSMYEELFNPTGIEKIIVKFPLGRYIMSVIRLKTMLKNYPYTNNDSAILLKNIILYTKENLKKISPNAQMIIILYDEKISTSHTKEEIKFCSDLMQNKIWNELQEEGIIIIHSKDLTGFYFDKDYKLEEDIADWHPNAKAWEVLTPLFAKKYIK